MISTINQALTIADVQDSETVTLGLLRGCGA
jgi:hypothetical protein